MKRLITITKEEIEYSLRFKKYNDAELLTRILYALKTMKAEGK